MNRQFRPTPLRRTHRHHDMDGGDRLALVAVWLLLAGGVLREVLGQTKIVSFGFYTFHSVDPGTLVALMAALVHLTKGRLARQPYTIPILIMASLISVNFLRGLAADAPIALLWIRANGGIAAILLLAVTMRPIPQVFRAARTALMLSALILGSLIAIRLATHPSFLMTIDVNDYEVNDGGRPLSAQGAFLLVLASAMVTGQVLSRPRLALDRYTLLVIGLPVLILLTRQGTANAAEFAVLATVIFLQKGHSQSWRILLGGFAVIGLLGLVALYLPSLVESEDLARRTNNLGTRWEIWSSLISLWPELPLSTQVFGFPAGQQPALLVYLSGGYRYWGLSIHSMYFGALPMMGYVGAVSYLAMMFLLLWSTLRAALRRRAPLSAIPLALCLATAVLSFSYEVRADAMIGLFATILYLRIAVPGLPKHRFRRPMQKGPIRRRQIAMSG